jgi:hypothetical protein
MGAVSNKIRKNVHALVDVLPETVIDECIEDNEKLYFLAESIKKLLNAPAGTTAKALSKRTSISVDALRGRLERLKKAKKRITHVPKPVPEPSPNNHIDENNLSQKAIWKIVDIQLGALITFMMENCEVPPNISDQTKLGILANIEMIKVYEQDLHNNGGHHEL